MSYYKGNYYQNPTPYTSSDIGEPVPGWGLDPRSYNQKMVGVGAIAVAKTSAASKVAVKTGTSTIRQYDVSQPVEVGTIPWYVYIGASAAIVGFAGFAYYKGWVG